MKFKFAQVKGIRSSFNKREIVITISVSLNKENYPLAMELANYGPEPTMSVEIYPHQLAMLEDRTDDAK